MPRPPNFSPPQLPKSSRATTHRTHRYHHFPAPAKMTTPISGASIRPQCLRKTFSCSPQVASKRNFSHSPSLNATLLRRPKRPYTFTQLVTLSDGSTFIHRTTSPMPVYKSNKDMRNTMMWNPSSQKLLNVEEDEAGRLRAFRERFGRGWDSEVTAENEEVSYICPAWFCLPKCSCYKQRRSTTDMRSARTAANIDRSLRVRRGSQRSNLMRA